MSRVLIVTGDIIGEKMAGPAIRAVEIARSLSINHQVVLTCPAISATCAALEGSPVGLECYGEEPSAAMMERFDVVIVPGSMVMNTRISVPLVVDLYDPFILSNLTRMEQSGNRQRFDDEFNILIEKLIAGDYFICASDRQRDFWIGMLSAVQRVNHIQYQSDSNLEALIDIVPFGISAIPPSTPVKSPFPAAVDGSWMIWAGGIWDWFDPLTLVQAAYELNRNGTPINLFFMGTRHPNPRVPEMNMTTRTIQLSRELHLLDTRVFFGDWIPYEKRGDYLMAAHMGISTHYPHLETRFSFRTRILDYIWARLPIICTAGDSFGDLVRRERLGVTVPPEDKFALIRAIRLLLEDQPFQTECRLNLDRIAHTLIWDQVTAPLNRFCQNPHKAPDKKAIFQSMTDHEEKFMGGCESKSEPVGEIVSSIVVSQKFVSEFSGLCRIDLRFATYMRSNTGILFVALIEARTNREVVKLPLDMQFAHDNAWHTFRFGPISDSASKEYIIRITSPMAVRGNALTVWVDRRVGDGFMMNGQHQAGNINYRVFARTTEIMEKPANFWLRFLPSWFKHVR